MSNMSISHTLAIQQWEDAHTGLLNAFTSYMDTCINLQKLSLGGLITKAEELVSRIEHHIASLSSVVNQTYQARSILSTTRNQLTSWIYGLPEEVLAKIFTQVVYDFADIKHRYQPIQQGVRAFYRRLYCLIGVCSSWRDIVFNQGKLWLIVPVIETKRNSGQLPSDAIERSLRRSCSARLYTAMDAENYYPTLLSPLINHGNRIWTLNIRTGYPHAMRQLLSGLATILVPGVLSELSMIAFGDCYKFTDHQVEEQELLKPIFSSLRSLRIRDSEINLSGLRFENLIELRLEHICLGDRLLFKQLLSTLSTISNLEYLHLFGLRTGRSSSASIMGPSHPQDLTNDDIPSVSFLNLKSVHIGDMCFHDLGALSRLIIPGNEEWTVSFGPDCVVCDNHGARSKISGRQLGLLLQGINISTLIFIVYKYFSNWLDGPQLSQILKAVPTVTTLKMSRWKFHRGVWEALTRPQGLETGSNLFPCIQKFHIHDSQIFDEHGIQSVVKSHRIQQLWLEAESEWASGRSKVLQKNDDIVVWLESNIADFQLGCSREEVEAENWWL